MRRWERLHGEGEGSSVCARMCVYVCVCVSIITAHVLLSPLVETNAFRNMSFNQ